MLNHFNFKRYEDELVLITNDFGCHLFLTNEEFQRMCLRDYTPGDALYQKLHECLFEVEPMELYSHEIADELRGMKGYLFSATTLHIFVLTNTCNMRCIYCQAQDRDSQGVRYMSVETARKAVDIALQSPEHSMTFEFQGGEPLLNFEVLKEIVEYTETARGTKQIDFTLVTNLALLTEEKLGFLIAHDVNLCTSIDGPPYLHDLNRRSNIGGGTYQNMEQKVSMLKARNCAYSAIQTTTRHSLPYGREIVRHYQKLGLPGIFLRPLTPLGFAKEDWAHIGYEAGEWLSFYRTAFEEILAVNREGTVFPEQHAVYFLKKILHGSALNYMELRSPCGAAVGQLAYYADGNVYACDEARMVSESGDQAFRLGNVYHDTYQDIISSNSCGVTCTASILESIPSCCDCIYQPYCGVCPVVSYAIDGDVFPRGPGDYRCQIYGGILDYLFSLLRDNNEETMKIIYSWIEGDTL